MDCKCSMAKQRQSAVAMAVALVCAWACALELTTFTSALDFHCSTTADSPTLNDAIDAVSTLINQEWCCQSNGWPWGSGCTTFGSLGTASIGICYDDRNYKVCIDCNSARMLFYDLIDQCADNSYGETTRVKGDVLHIHVDGGDPTLALILFSI